MNERILELARQVWPDPNTSHVNHEKFAELIIKECANAIVNDSRLSDVRTARNACVRTIKEHFGVEE